MDAWMDCKNNALAENYQYIFHIYIYFQCSRPKTFTWIPKNFKCIKMIYAVVFFFFFLNYWLFKL